VEGRHEQPRPGPCVRTNGRATGWYVETLNEDVPTAECPMCAAGAIRFVTTGSPTGESALTDEALYFLSARVDSAIFATDPTERIADWNDSAGRTDADVIDVLLAVASEAGELDAA
jgi:hypothetical protein